MSDETEAAVRRQQWIEALLEERRGYVTAGRSDRVADVDEQLRLAGHRSPAGRSPESAETATVTTAPRGRSRAAKPKEQAYPASRS